MFQFLPDDILVRIASLLTKTELKSFSLACKRFAHIRREVKPIEVSPTSRNLSFIGEFNVQAVIKIIPVPTNINLSESNIYNDLYMRHESALQHFISELNSMDSPSSSSVISEMMSNRHLPQELLGFLISDLTSARMKLLVFIELISIAFKKSLAERSNDKSALVSHLNLFLGRSENFVSKRNELESLIAKHCAPVVSTFDIHLYINRLLYNSAIFFQYLRGLLHAADIELTVAAKTKLLNSCESSNSLITSTMLTASVTPIEPIDGYALCNEDVIMKLPEFEEENEYETIEKDDTSLSVSTSSLISQPVEESEDEEWIVVDPVAAVKEEEKEKTVDKVKWYKKKITSKLKTSLTNIFE